MSRVSESETTSDGRSADTGTGTNGHSEKDDEQGKENGNEKEKPQKPKRPIYTRPAFWIVIGVLVVAGIVFGLLYLFDWRFKVTTDDAFIAAHSTTVSPRISGHVEQVLVDDNQDVKKGAVLVVLDERDAQQAVSGAQASYESAQAQLAQAMAQEASAKADVAQAHAAVISADASAKQAQSDQERYQKVLATDPRAVSQQQVDQVNATARTTAAQLESAKSKEGASDAQVKVAQAQITAAGAMIDKAKSDLDNARLQLSYTKIIAADDGQVTNRSVEVGNYVTPGQALMSLVPREVYVVGNYKETQLKNVRLNQPVKIHVDAYGINLDGHVQSIQAGSGSAFSLLPPENATGNYVKVVQRLPIKITFDRLPDQRLSPGMSVEPTIDTHER